MIYSFLNDYSEGCHPEILEILRSTNEGQESGYGEDTLCSWATTLIRKEIDRPLADIHFVSGATQANRIIISSALRPHEAVIAAKTGHIAIHEAGAIEASGHKVCVVDSSDGKLTPSLVDDVIRFHSDEHMVKPKMVYVSDTTELGTVYSKEELMAIAGYCADNGLMFFIDGARIAQALTSPANNITLKELALLPDIFYLGGTKNGALLGEAIVINNEALKRDFRFNMKQNGALLAKGRLIGVQFMALFNNGLFLRNGLHANAMALKLAEGIKSAGYDFLCEPVSNQIFPIFPNKLIEILKVDYDFYIWSFYDNERSVVRLVTSWATPEEEINSFINRFVDIS